MNLVMHRQRAITTALTLLFAVVLSLGGASAVHVLSDHHDLKATEHRCCEAPPEGPNLPADEDSQNKDCPECALLTTLTVADTSASADLIIASAPQHTIHSIEVAPAVARTHAPRTTRGPPAA